MYNKGRSPTSCIMRVVAHFMYYKGCLPQFIKKKTNKCHVIFIPYLFATKKSSDLSI